MKSLTNFIKYLTMLEKFHTRFDPNLSYDGYDHLIIGSGISALTAAAFLSKGGHKVLILEKHHKPGGFTHSFKRKNGFKWDVGVHYVGNVGKGQPLRKTFDYISNGELDWDSMGAVYDLVKIGDKTYEFMAGEEAQKKQLLSYFPKEIEAINKYFQLIKDTNKWANAFFFEKTFKPILSKTLGCLLRYKFGKYAKKTTFQTLSEITSNQELIAVLSSQCGNYGLAPKESSFVAHALVIGHFLNGGYYPKGGAEMIASKIIKVIDGLGSKVVVNAAVEQIVIEKNCVTGLIVNGNFIACKSVISTIGANNTFNNLIPSDLLSKERNSINKIGASTGHICLYIGLNKSDKDLNLPKYNVWLHRNNNIDNNLSEVSIDNAAEQFSYISFPSAKDTLWQQKHPNQSTIQALSVAKFDWFKDYAMQTPMNRDLAYKTLKKDFEERMLAKVVELFPQIKNHVQVLEVSTPLSTKHYSSYAHGEIYGLKHNIQRFDCQALRFETKIKGLRLAGQDIIIVGVGGALNAGLLCATTILKFKVRHLFKDMSQQKY